MALSSNQYFIQVREKYAKGEIDRATAWVEKTFERYVEMEGKGKRKKGSLYVTRMVVTPFEIDNGLAREDKEGWYEAQHVLTENVAMLYIDIILDDSIPDEDKALAIAEYDEGAGHGYGPYFRNYPDAPFYVLPMDEIDRRNEHYREENEKKGRLAQIILDPLTSEEAKTHAREELGIP